MGKAFYLLMHDVCETAAIQPQVEFLEQNSTKILLQVEFFRDMM